MEADQCSEVITIIHTSDIGDVHYSGSRGGREK